MKHSILSLGCWLWLCLLFPGCEKSGSSAQPLPKLFQLPAFTLTERTGQPFNSATMQGKVWVASFFFASCPGTCPILNKQMQAIEKDTEGQSNFGLLSIATDESDTPEVLRNTADLLHAGSRWFFVTGKKDQVFNLSVNGFKLALKDADGVNVKEKIIHSTKIALIDQQGWIRGYYDGVGDNAPEEKTRLLADIKRLLAE